MPLPDAVTGLAGVAFASGAVRLTWLTPATIVDPAGAVSGSSSDTSTITASAAITGAGVGSASTSDAADIVASGISYGPVVYTQAEIDAWQSTAVQYSRLLSSWGGNNARTVTNHGSAITTDTAREALRWDSVYAVCQAALWAANGETARRTKVIEVLDGVKNVASWTGQGGQINLVAGWTATNLCKAARIVGYSDAGFSTFLRHLCRTIGAPDNAGTGQAVLDWTRGVNWHASFADSRIQIASYLQDAALWSEAVEYFHFRITQGIYHATYDGGSVNPVRTGNWPQTRTGTPSASATSDHWWTLVTAAPWTAERADLPGSQPFSSGFDGEIARDLAHESFTLVAYCNAARTIRSVGDAVEPQAHDRLLAMAASHASRCLYYIKNGSLKPDGFNGKNVVAGFPTGVGGKQYLWCWGQVRSYFGADTPTDVTSLMNRTEVQTADPTGFDHLAAPLFTEGVQ